MLHTGNICFVIISIYYYMSAVWMDKSLIIYKNDIMYVILYYLDTTRLHHIIYI